MLQLNYKNFTLKLVAEITKKEKYIKFESNQTKLLDILIP